MEYVTLRTSVEVGKGRLARIRYRQAVHQVVGRRTACGRRITEQYERTNLRPTDHLCQCCQEGRKR